MPPNIAKYLADLSAWQVEVAKWVAAQIAHHGGVSTADSGNNGGGNPPPPPPPPEPGLGGN